MPQQYWTDSDKSATEVARSFAELLPTALSVIKRMPQPVAMVSGPMSTGGSGSIEKNVERFTRAVHALSQTGITVFNQMPFQEAMSRLLKRHNHTQAYYMPLLEDFYLPLFESGLITTIYFLPDWQSSTGAAWEHAQCLRLGIGIKPFPVKVLS